MFKNPRVDIPQMANKNTENLIRAGRLGFNYSLFFCILFYQVRNR